MNISKLDQHATGIVVSLFRSASAPKEILAKCQLEASLSCYWINFIPEIGKEARPTEAHMALFNGCQLYIAPSIISCHVYLVSSNDSSAGEHKGTWESLTEPQADTQYHHFICPFPLLAGKETPSYPKIQATHGAPQCFLRNCKQAAYANETYYHNFPSPLTKGVIYCLELLTEQLTWICENGVSNIITDWPTNSICELDLNTYKINIR